MSVRNSKYRHQLVFAIAATLLILLFIRNLVVNFSRGPAEVLAAERFNDSIKAIVNYSFSGIVRNYEEFIIERGTHIGVATLDIRRTDIDEFDPKDSSDIYPYILRNGEARVLFAIQYELERKRGGIKHGSVRVGDSLVIDGIKDRVFLFYEQDSASWNNMWLSPYSEHRQRVIKYLRRNDI